MRGSPHILLRLPVLLLALGAEAVFAQTAPKCLVIDPELQGAYEGGCRNGKAEGFGKASGTASYIGYFHEGKKQGQGIKTWSWGDRYEGGFLDDSKSGEGRYVWGQKTLFAGDWYEGHFLDDRRDGFGFYHWGSGDSYAGPWKADAVAGIATPMMISRYRATTASLEAMEKTGVKLCRNSALGIGLTERVEGESQGINKDSRQVSVKITLLGQSPFLVAGTEVKLGDIVWDDPLNWIPCN
jgi:hypothetical protein